MAPRKVTAKQITVPAESGTDENGSLILKEMTKTVFREQRWQRDDTFYFTDKVKKKPEPRKPMSKIYLTKQGKDSLGRPTLQYRKVFQTSKSFFTQFLSWSISDSCPISHRLI